MLDLARALATGPRLLLIDELAAGLNPAELERVAQKLEELAHSGIALLVVEHLMGFIDHITDRVIVMNAGKEIFEAGCIPCHGADGRGQAPALQGFERPRTFPDFTDCAGSTPEPDAQWRFHAEKAGTFPYVCTLHPGMKGTLIVRQ